MSKLQQFSEFLTSKGVEIPTADVLAQSLSLAESAMEKAVSQYSESNEYHVYHDMSVTASMMRHPKSQQHAEGVSSFQKNLWAYECPKCKSHNCFNGNPTTGTKFRGGGECFDCGHTFSIVGMKLKPIEQAEQFEESEGLKRLRDLIAKGYVARLQLARQRIAQISDTPFGLDTAQMLIGRELESLRGFLAADMTTAGYGAWLDGAAHISDDIAGLPDYHPSKEVIPLFPPSVGITPGMPLEALTRALGASSRQSGPAVHLPVLSATAQRLGASKALQGLDCRATADLVRQDAFALTGQLTERGVEQVKTTFEQGMAEGWGVKEFVDKVGDRLQHEQFPLSEPHIENIVRTNAQRYLQDGKYDALQQPLVKTAFPYVGYNATADARVRAEHEELEKLGLDGTNAYNLDDPTFKKFRPPWSYNCRCSFHPMTVEQAARRGVKEAEAWWQRANDQAKAQGISPYEALETTKPVEFEFVTPPPFDPPEGFQRAT